MQNVFVFAVESAVSKAGKPYKFQRVQVVQSPNRPDVIARYFVNDGAEPLAPGKYVCEVYFRDTPTGLRPVFDNFVKAE